MTEVSKMTATPRQRAEAAYMTLSATDEYKKEIIKRLESK